MIKKFIGNVHTIWLLIPYPAFFRYLSVIDKTRHYYTLCRAASPVDTPPCGTPTKQLQAPEVVDDEGYQPEMEYEDEFESSDVTEASNTAPAVAGEELFVKMSGSGVLLQTTIRHFFLIFCNRAKSDTALLI